MPMEVTAVCISFESENYEKKVVEIIHLYGRSPSTKELTKLLRTKYPMDIYGLIKVEATKTVVQSHWETTTLCPPKSIFTEYTLAERKS